MNQPHNSLEKRLLTNTYDMRSVRFQLNKLTRLQLLLRSSLDQVEAGRQFMGWLRLNSWNSNSNCLKPLLTTHIHIRNILQTHAAHTRCISLPVWIAWVVCHSQHRFHELIERRFMKRSVRVRHSFRLWHRPFKRERRHGLPSTLDSAFIYVELALFLLLPCLPSLEL
jgi:hypothetical protein